MKMYQIGPVIGNLHPVKGRFLALLEKSNFFKFTLRLNINRVRKGCLGLRPPVFFSAKIRFERKSGSLQNDKSQGKQDLSGRKVQELLKVFFQNQALCNCASR
jgi:hypothetical protein